MLVALRLIRLWLINQILKLIFSRVFDAILQRNAKSSCDCLHLQNSWGVPSHRPRPRCLVSPESFDFDFVQGSQNDKIEMIQTDLPQSYCGSTSSGLASSVISWLTSMLHKNDCPLKRWEGSCVKVFLPELLCIDLPRLVLAKIDNNTINHTSSLEQGQKRNQMLNNLPLEFWGGDYIDILPGLSNWEPLGQRWGWCLVQSCVSRRLSRKQTNWKCRNWRNSKLLKTYFCFS